MRGKIVDGSEFGFTANALNRLNTQDLVIDITVGEIKNMGFHLTFGHLKHGADTDIGCGGQPVIFALYFHAAGINAIGRVEGVVEKDVRCRITKFMAAAVTTENFSLNFPVPAE